MRMPSKREWILIAIVPLIFLLAAGIDTSGNDASPVVAEVVHSARANAKRSSRPVIDAGQLDLSGLERARPAAAPQDLFVAKSWYVAPPPAPRAPAAKPLPPQPPKAPPLPFTYLGRYVNSGKTIFLLVAGDRILTVKQGDVVQGNYRVDGRSGSTLGLTYMPLNIKQSLDIGSE